MPDPIVALSPAPAPAASTGGVPSAPASVSTPVGTAGTPGVSGTSSPAQAPAVQPAVAPAPAVAPPITPPVDWADREARFNSQKAELEATIARMGPMARLGYEEYQRRAGQPAPVPPVAPVPEPKKSPFNIPPFADELKAFIGYGADGNPTEKPGAPPGTLAAFQANQSAKVRAVEQLLNDPKSLIAPYIDDIKKEAVVEAEKALQGKALQARRAQVEDQIFAENKAWMCQLDQAGNPVVNRDPMTGAANAVWTADGVVFVQAYQKLVNSGLAPTEAREFAEGQVAYQRLIRQMSGSNAAAAAGQPAAAAPAAAAVAPAAPPSPPTAPADPRKAFLDQMNAILKPSPAANQPPQQNLNLPTAPAQIASTGNAKADAIRFFNESYKAHGHPVGGTAA
jgi:hypothetical protein